MISPEQLQGLAAEYLVCADLCKLGYPAVLAPAGSRYDVIADINGRFLRIQVKSRAIAKIPSTSHKKPTYKFRIWNSNKGIGRKKEKPLSSHEIDAVALVAMDINTIAYLTPAYCMKKSVQLKPPGSVGDRRNKADNVDQFPFSQLLEELTQ